MPDLVSIHEMHNYKDKYDWFVRLETKTGKFYEGGRLPKHPSYHDNAGAWYIRFGKLGSSGQQRVKSSYTDVVTALNKKASKPEYKAVEPKAKPMLRCEIYIYKYIDPGNIISTIKAIRQIHSDFGLDDSLRFCKRVAEQLRDNGKAQVTRYIELDTYGVAALRDRYEKLGFTFSGQAVAPEIQVDLSQYEMFSQVAYVRWSEESHGTGMCWRGYDSQHRKLMVVPAKLVPTSS